MAAAALHDGRGIKIAKHRRRQYQASASRRHRGVTAAYQNRRQRRSVSLAERKAATISIRRQAYRDKGVTYRQCSSKIAEAALMVWRKQHIVGDCYASCAARYDQHSASAHCMKRR